MKTRYNRGAAEPLGSSTGSTPPTHGETSESPATQYSPSAGEVGGDERRSWGQPEPDPALQNLVHFDRFCGTHGTEQMSLPRRATVPICCEMARFSIALVVDTQELIRPGGSRLMLHREVRVP